MKWTKEEETLLKYVGVGAKTVETYWLVFGYSLIWKITKEPIHWCKHKARMTYNNRIELHKHWTTDSTLKKYRTENRYDEQMIFHLHLSHYNRDRTPHSTHYTCRRIFQIELDFSEFGFSQVESFLRWTPNIHIFCCAGYWVLLDEKPFFVSFLNIDHFHWLPALIYSLVYLCTGFMCIWSFRKVSPDHFNWLIL